MHTFKNIVLFITFPLWFFPLMLVSVLLMLTNIATGYPKNKYDY